MDPGPDPEKLQREPPKERTMYYSCTPIETLGSVTYFIFA